MAIARPVHWLAASAHAKSAPNAHASARLIKDRADDFFELTLSQTSTFIFARANGLKLPPAVYAFCARYDKSYFVAN